MSAEPVEATSWDYIRRILKWVVVGLCCGLLAGLLLAIYAGGGLSGWLRQVRDLESQGGGLPLEGNLIPALTYVFVVCGGIAGALVGTFAGFIAAASLDRRRA